MSDTGLERCATCGQIPNGQSGEYLCPDCGVPTLHDDAIEGKNTFEFSDVSTLTEDYWLALFDERKCMTDVVKAREAVDFERMRVSKIAAPAATGKTVGERLEQVNEFIESNDELSNGLYWLGSHLSICEYELSSAEIHRKTIEAEISLTKAWLYSQSGAPR